MTFEDYITDLKEHGIKHVDIIPWQEGQSTLGKRIALDHFFNIIAKAKELDSYKTLELKEK